MVLIEMPDAGYILLLSIVIVVSSVFNEYYRENIDMHKKTRTQRCVLIFEWVVELTLIIIFLIILLNVLDVLVRIVIEILRSYL